MAKVTKRVVDTTHAGTADRFVWDEELRGFGLRVFTSGVKSYLVQYRAKGRTRRLTIGTHGRLTPDQARTRARQLLADVAGGADPAERRREEHRAETVADFVNRYLDHARTHLKRATVVDYEWLVKRNVLPRFGTRKVADVTHTDAQRMHRDLAPTPYEANRTLAVLSLLMTTAERWGLRPAGTNPCRHVARYKEHRRTRFLSSQELARLSAALADVAREQVELASVVPAIRLLIFTGARLSEILTLKWDYVDLERQCLNLPDSKTGAKVIHLNAPAMEILANVPRDDDSPWVIRGRHAGTRLINLQLPWRRIRTRAELPEVRLHDLRHSFASVGAATGNSLLLIGGLLGHTQASTTQRYAHLYADPLKEAADTIGRRLQAMMNSKVDNTDNVVALKQPA